MKKKKKKILFTLISSTIHFFNLLSHSPFLPSSSLFLFFFFLKKRRGGKKNVPSSKRSLNGRSMYSTAHLDCSLLDYIARLIRNPRLIGYDDAREKNPFTSGRSAAPRRFKINSNLGSDLAYKVLSRFCRGEKMIVTGSPNWT